MNLEFFVHGVPYGHCVWNGDKVEDGFINNFYVSYKDVREQVRLVVDIARKGNAVSSYYTYLRTINFFDAEGRSGSFFGMTLRFDGYYCREVAHIYDILDEAYRRMIVGKIIDNSDGKSKYRISDFKQADAVLRGVCSDIFSKLSESMCRPIDGSFAGRDTKRIEAFNIADTDCPAFFESLRQSGKAYVSPEYPTRSAIQTELQRRWQAERENVAREQKLSADRQRRIDELEQDAERKNNAIAQLNGEKARLQQQIDDNPLKKELAAERQRSLKLEEDIQVLEQRNHELESRGLQLGDDVHEQIAALYDDMKKMRRLLREYRRPERSSDNPNPKPNIISRIVAVLRRRAVMWIILFVVLAGAAYCVHSCNAEKNTPQTKELPPEQQGTGDGKDNPKHVNENEEKTV